MTALVRVLGAGLLGAALGAAPACKSDPNAPPKIAWDHVACDHCGMLVGDPAHAAALVTREGETKVFDDPGCLFRYVVERKPSVAAMWFSDGETWYRESQVAFATGYTTPMGSGLHAVPVGTPNALSVGEASARALAR